MYRSYCACFVIAVCQATGVGAQEGNQLQGLEQVYNLKIARSDAASALNQLASQTDRVIVFSYEQAVHRQTNALYGYFTFEQALKYLLQGSGLEASTQANGAIQIAVSSPVVEPVTPTEVVVEEHTVAESKVEIIEVAGIRKSMLRAQDIKRQSGAIIDVIVAEDIGKLPDITAAESIARLPGVQVTRFNDETNGILIRGLPYHATTYNGREIFTAELRRLQLQDMPSQMLAGIEVYKPGSVDVIEPGLAGIVNAITRRPFDFNGQKVAGGVHVNYNDQSANVLPSGHLLYSNRWDTDAGELGFLLNASYAESEFYNGVRYASTNYAFAQPTWQISPDELSGGNFFFPSYVGLYNSGGSRKRPSFNVAMQWRPVSDLEFYTEALYQGYRKEGVTDYFNANLNWSDSQFGAPVLDDVELVEGSEDQALSFIKNGGLRQEGYRGVNAESTNTNQVALGMIWTSDEFRVQTDIALTNSYYQNTTWSLDFALTEPQTIAVNFDTDGGVVFDLPGFNAEDVQQYLWRGYFESDKHTSGEGIQWRTDVSYYTPWKFLHTLKVGGRYTDRTAEVSGGWRYTNTLDLGIGLSELPVGDMELTPDPYRTNKQGFTRFLVQGRDILATRHDEFRQLTLNAIDEMLILYPERSWLQGDRDRFSSVEIPDDPSGTFNADEQSLALYLQGAFEFDLGTTEVDGTAGVRVIQIKRDAFGSSIINSEGQNLIQPAVDHDDFLDVLPALSLRARITNDFYVRLGYTQALTPVDFGMLNPAINITRVLDANIDDSSDTVEAYGSSGNPALEPLTSTNYDLSLEYYFTQGYLSAAGFYRELFGFPNYYTQTVEDAEFGTVQLTQPENSDQGKIYGFEANAQTLFSFLPGLWKGVGVRANVTYLKGLYKQRNNDGSFSDYQDITGLSDWTYNFSTFYENDGFSVRVSYNYRSPWINWYGTPSESGTFTGSKTHSRERMDLSVSYNLDKHLKVYFDIRNLSAKPFRNYLQINESQSYTIDVRDEGRYYGLGLMFDY